MSSTARQADPHLVGRSFEMDAIARAIDAVGRGRGHMLMLSGEPGIGKSTLARHAADIAAEQGIAVFWGFSWEGGGAPAYWPWTQLLGSLTAELAPPNQLTDKLQQLLPDQECCEEVPGLQPHQAQFQLLESVRRLLDHVARKQPLAIVLEDLHAADAASLHLLNHIARHVSAVPIVVIGTFREAEARRMESGESLWNACRNAEVLPLQRLGADEVRAYLDSRQAGGMSAADVERLLRTTEGNPLFLAELVGLLVQSDGEDLPLPASVQQVIRQQVELLPEDTRGTLAAGSILGREFDTASLAAISDSDEPGLESSLLVAIDAGLLRRTTEGQYRFAHVLHRDVLYQDMPEADRARLHVAYGHFIMSRIESGDEDRWTELANHMRAAGSEHRAEAIEAWRHAARRAMQRLAFEDAVMFLAKALAALDEGPRFDPRDRYELLLECASAAHLTGDTETGHGYCRDAFDIARSLSDATLMAEAALTWGSAIVVARVDSELIAALRECLGALPENDAPLRARVQARLAGALQPAPNPAEPMDMAREAIALARTTNDEYVLYSVLRSAISALMDFAPSDETLALNEEFGALAEKYGDVPGQFRSKLRLMICACEMADRVRMDVYIEECYHLAERIGLPHYRWRAASARAMQATIDGDFARANQLLDAAQAYADEADEFEAKVTIPLQRFAILIDWDSDAGESLEQIEARLQDAYASGMPNAEFFVTPFINSHKHPPHPEVARRMLSNKLIVERTFAGGDRYSLCRLGELAALAKDTELAERIYRINLPYVEHCATLGLMGTSCSGPIAWSLGVIAASLGKHDEALELLDKALGIAESMRGPPWIARIHADISRIAGEAGDEERSKRHAAAFEKQRDRLRLRDVRSASSDTPIAATPAQASPPVETSVPFSLAKDGELWRVEFGSAAAMLKASRGLDLLAALVERPHEEIHVLDLSGGGAVKDERESGPAIDPEARKQYEQRIRELREELEEAESFGDAGRADAARGEIDFITRELSRAFGLGGKARPGGDAAERARVNVRRRLTDAIRRIGEQLPDAGRYLENTIKTGTYCRYTPM